MGGYVRSFKGKYLVFCNFSNFKRNIFWRKVSFQMKSYGPTMDFYKSIRIPNFPILNGIFSGEKSLFKWNPMVQPGTFIKVYCLRCDWLFQGKLYMNPFLSWYAHLYAFQKKLKCYPFYSTYISVSQRIRIKSCKLLPTSFVAESVATVPRRRYIQSSSSSTPKNHAT